MGAGNFDLSKLGDEFFRLVLFPCHLALFDQMR